MKKIKSIFTLFVALMLTISVLGTSVFAATSYDGNTNPNKTGVTIEKNGIGGKDASDSYYAINSACPSRESSFVLPNFANGFEAQFMLSSEDAAMQIRTILHANAKDSSSNYSYTYIEVNANEVFFNHKSGSTASWAKKWTKAIDLTPGIWYTFTAIYGDKSANSGEQEAAYYINGELVHEGSEFSNLYGIRNWSFGAKEEDKTIYVDNIYASNGRGASSDTHVIDINRQSPSEITSVASDMVLDGEEKTVVVNPYTTVADIKNTIVTTDGADDIVKVLKPDLVTVADDDSYAGGNVIVVAAKNGQTTEQAYNYYNIEEVEFDGEKGRGKNASDLHVASGTYNITSEGGLFGKTYHDEAYKIEYVGSGEGISIANTLFDKATIGGSYGFFKCQFALEEGAMLTIHYAMSPDPSNYVRMNIEEGCTTLGSKKEQLLSAPIETGKWHTLCMVGPISDDKNGSLKVYIDGELVRDQEVSEDYYGMRRPFIVPEAGISYIDNIEVRATNVYDASEDIDSWLDIDNAIVKGDKIRYTAMPEVSDFHPGANTNVRFFDADWNELRNTTDAKYVVAGEKDAQGFETRISYYTFAENASDYIAGGYYDKDNNFYVKAYGKNAGDSLYYATYESAGKDELAEVVSGAMNTADNKAEISGTFGDKSYRFFFWDKDVNPLVKSISLELKK